MRLARAALALCLFPLACGDDGDGPADATDTAPADVADTRPGDTDPADTSTDAVDAADTVTPPATIGWARLQYPPELVASPQATFQVYGRVYVEGVTDGPGQGPGVDAEAGLGRADAAVASWAWVPAAFNVDVDEGANDEYLATLTAPSEAGSWRFAYRFRVGGGDWVYADRSGTDSGFDVADAGHLTVVPSAPEAVDWCALQHPPALTVAPGAPTGPIFGRVYEPGVTGTGSVGDAIVGELGWGADPAAPQGWSWVAASFNTSVGNDDEYMAALAGPSELGTYAYGYRFRLASGGEWTYCDLSGSDDGWDPLAAGVLTVSEAAPEVVDWALLRPPTLAWAEGATRPNVEVVVYEADATPGVGPGADIAVEVLFGPVGALPADAPGEWVTLEATYDRDEDGLGSLDNDVFVVQAPALPIGTHAYAARVSVDGGDTWTWVDTDGTGSGFSVAALGVATVREADPPMVDWCRIAPPFAVGVAPGGEARLLAEVFHDGITQTGDPSGIVGEAGYGVLGSDPGGPSWTWTAASFSADLGNNDLWEATVTAPTEEAVYHWAFRFRLEGETTWRVCDRDGSDNGYTPSQAGILHVIGSAPTTVEWGVVRPDEVAWAACTPRPVVEVEVYAPGVTTGPGQGPGLRVEVGFGEVGSDPAAWTWQPAIYLADTGGVGDAMANDLYGWEPVGVPAGTWSLAGRASLDDGASWVLLDTDPLSPIAADLDPDLAATLTVEGPSSVCWARVIGGLPSQLAPEAGLTVEVEVWIETVTDAEGEGEGVEVEVGLGDVGSDPAASASWSWHAADYAGDLDGAYPLAHDLYRWVGAAPAVTGEVAIAARARYLGGDWVFIDLDGTDSGYDPSAAHTLLVTDGPLLPTWCKIQWPEAPVTVAAGEVTPLLYGWAYEPGVTGAGGTGSIFAEVGFGPAASDPSVDETGWTWAAGEFNEHKDNGFGEIVNTEYQGSLTPPTEGTYAWLWRFSLDGAAWRYCDYPGGPDFDASQIGTLVVSD